MRERIAVNCTEARSADPRGILQTVSDLFPQYKR
jgi:hypothetical protein